MAGVSTPDITIFAPEDVKDDPSHLVQATKLADKGADRATDVYPSDIPLGSQNVTVQHMKNISNADKANTMINIGSSAMGQLDTLTACLQPLKAFNNVVNTIVDTVLAQTNRDQSINDLLFKIGHVYSFIIEDDTLANINVIREPLAKIGELVRKGVQFIQNYAEVKSFWGRLCKNVFTETDNVIAAYSKDLDALTQHCRDMITRDMRGDVRKVLGDIRSARDGISRVLDEVTHADEKVQINQLPYASGAGLNLTKTCLDGTRTTILSEIVEWVYNTGSGTHRVLWLHGQAGKGKSAIAHTVAKGFKELGILGSCFCFTRDRLADRRHEKIFATIARDLGKYDPSFRRALASVVADDDALAHTSDVTQQWQKFILEPFARISTRRSAPVLIVIDALDESGNEDSRLHILQTLASVEVASLPAVVRILVTSRPLNDIIETLHGASHVKSKSMDEISIDTAKHDIQVYIRHQLRTLADSPSEDEIGCLAEISDGLFEWARLACEFIKSSKEATTTTERYQELMSVISGGSKDLLDDMYKVILDNAISKSNTTRARFRSVMCQILCTKEPLSIDSLNAMRSKFSRREDKYDVNLILRSMGALLSGVADRSTPVRPLHASFFDFLTDGLRSGEFAIDIGSMHVNLALASLGIMEEELCFNICQLESSYMWNSEVKDLDLRVKQRISVYLSYACRFWVDHVKDVKNGEHLQKEVKHFFKEKFLFWIEVLSLLQSLNNATAALIVIAQWMEVGLLSFQNEYD
ncbi:hypothetical protein ID866_8144 [Astraeus odoratus]|nr:hypothetical protein ID866_8144 [Astraeus odoratus]